MRTYLSAYKSESKNEILFIISDSTVKDETTNKELPLQVKTEEDVNQFFEKLLKLCKENYFDVEAFGLKKQMIDRLSKKAESESK